MPADPDEIEALIAKLESASEGSESLNRQIGRLIGWHRVEPRFLSNNRGGWIAPGDWIGTTSDGSPILDGLHGTTIHREPPDFTRSVDAALTLVPEGWSYALYGPVQHHPFHEAQIEPDRDPREPLMDGSSKSPALALCIAALKARKESPDAP